MSKKGRKNSKRHFNSKVFHFSKYQYNANLHELLLKLWRIYSRSRRHAILKHLGHHRHKLLHHRRHHLCHPCLLLLLSWRRWRDLGYWLVVLSWMFDILATKIKHKFLKFLSLFQKILKLSTTAGKLITKVNLQAKCPRTRVFMNSAKVLKNLTAEQTLLMPVLARTLLQDEELLREKRTVILPNTKTVNPLTCANRWLAGRRDGHTDHRREFGDRHVAVVVDAARIYCGPAVAEVATRLRLQMLDAYCDFCGAPCRRDHRPTTHCRLCVCRRLRLLNLCSMPRPIRNWTSGARAAVSVPVLKTTGREASLPSTPYV
uniref:Uncharacterized protein n=1 Tax=Romanomermis culicivorax TaxID=13658 RepID=A0A915KU43_ROMCU